MWGIGWRPRMRRRSGRSGTAWIGLSRCWGSWGGLAEAEEREDGFVIRGASCSLAATLPGHPELCRLAETLLSDLIGIPEAECCERGDQPRCCFAVPAPDAQ